MSETFENAIRSGDVDAAREVLDSGESPSSATASGLPYLSLAALVGGAGMVRLLLDAGAGVDQRDTNGATALTAASGCGRCEEVRLLLERGADPDVVDSSGEISSRPIWQCVFSAESNADTLRALVEGGAVVAGCDQHGHTLLDYATPEQLVVLTDAVS